MAKNVILLGGSNSVMVNGLQKGLREGIEKYNARLETEENKEPSNANANLKLSSNIPKNSNTKEKLEFHNLALGATSCIQSLYELVRYQELVKNAELIIAESNVNDTQEYYALGNETLIARNIFLFYNYLYQFNKKVLILVLPYQVGEKEIIQKINKIHQFYADKYGFNFINMYEFYEQNHLFDLLKYDSFHQIPALMKFYGKKFIKMISSFKMPKTLSPKIDHTFNQYAICTPEDMHKNAEIEKINAKNSVFNENIFRLEGQKTLTFNEKFEGYDILLIHAWNLTDLPWTWPECCGISSDIVIENIHSATVKTFAYCNQFQTLIKPFKIDKYTKVKFNFQHLAPTERSYCAFHGQKDLEHIDIIGFLLVKNLQFEPKIFKDFVPVKIEPKYDFTFLISEIVDFKDVIDEWNNNRKRENLDVAEQKDKEILNLKTENERLKIFEDEIKTLPVLKEKQELANLKLDENVKKLEVKKLEKELGIKLSKLEPRVILNLNENLKNSAVARVRNHLAYRLGAAIIVCNKSFFGICSLPFVLSFIKNQYKKEQTAYQTLIKQRPELKLPALENYADYEAGLKEKECFTYKLGLALMRADKTWLSGGYIKFYFKAKKLEREFKNNKG